MKIKFLKVAAMSLLCTMLVVSICSCHKDDDNTNSNEQYGQFIIKNLSSNEILDGSEAMIVPEDLLTITFVPTDKYKHLSFEVKKTYNGKEVKDTFAIPSTSIKVSTTVNGIELTQIHKLELSASAKSGTEYLKTDRTVNFSFHDKSSRAVCSVHAMTDLLMFVEPVVKFTDNRGNSVECRPFEGMTIKRDSIDKDGIKLELSNDWSKAVRYTQWDNEAEATLSFVKKQPVELARESYDMDCSFFLNGYSYEKNYSPLSMSVNISVKINLNGQNKMEDEHGNIKKEFVEEYINKLVETTQTKRIRIDENGKITEIFN